MSLPYNKNNTQLARKLRKEATPQERHLWYDFLRGYEVRFARQKPIGDYIVDFYCHKAGLIVELDGSQHYDEGGHKQDKIRSQALEGCGLKILRFANNDVDRNFSGVCQTIDLEVQKLIKKRDV